MSLCLTVEAPHFEKPFATAIPMEKALIMPMIQILLCAPLTHWLTCTLTLLSSQCLCLLNLNDLRDINQYLEVCYVQQ